MGSSKEKYQDQTVTIIIDSDGLIGSLNLDDVHYAVCKKTLLKLLERNATLIYPATTIAESVTLLQGRLNKTELARAVIQKVITGKLFIETVDDRIMRGACSLMNLKASKHHTLFDAIVAVVAEKHHADAIFSFDSFYKKKGFRLASELVK